MKLLILTQKIDKKDDVLGFFHGWLEAFSRQFNFITAICLEMGEHSLPKNVKVFSLGKEKKVSRAGYILSFYKAIWANRHEYDYVFVHMNEEYVLLGGVLWRLLGKRVYLWRNHLKGTWKTRFACRLSHRVLFSSPQSFVAYSKNGIQMPAGVDTDLLQRDILVKKKERSILSLGRLSPVKKIDMMIDAFKRLKDEGEVFRAFIYGNAPARDKEYESKIKEKVRVEKISEVVFCPAISNLEAPHTYNEYEHFINLTESGSFDKAILEAMACGLLVLTPNVFLERVLPAVCFLDVSTPEMIAKKLREQLALTSSEKVGFGKDLRRYVVENQSLTLLVARFSKILESDTLGRL